MQGVTIIVPVYNTKKYLDECMNSLINQTYKDIKVIVVDDGSTDGSGEICDHYAQLIYSESGPKIEVIHKTNGGLSSARNLGIERAMSDDHCTWILFVDSDDVVDKELVDQLMKIANERIVDIVCFEMPKLYGERVSQYVVYQDEQLYTAENRWKLLFGEHGCGDYMCNKMFKKQLFQNVRFPLNRAYEDMCVSHMLFNIANNVYACKGVNYYYRQLPNSISNTVANTDYLMQLLYASDQQYLWFVENCAPYSVQAFSKCISSYAKVLVKLWERKKFWEDKALVDKCIKWTKDNKCKIQQNEYANLNHKAICLKASGGLLHWITIQLFERIKR